MRHAFKSFEIVSITRHLETPIGSQLDPGSTEFASDSSSDSLTEKRSDLSSGEEFNLRFEFFFIRWS